jgi:integrase
VIDAASRVLADAQQQGLVSRNVAEHIDRIENDAEPSDTYTEAEVAGLRWADIDFDGKTLSIVNNRVSAGGRSVENAPKSNASRRTLPLPERLALGASYRSGAYVVSNEIGDPYSPAVLLLLAGHGEGRRGAPHRVARGAAHLRHSDASAGHPGSRDRGLDRAQGRRVVAVHRGADDGNRTRVFSLGS